MLKNAQRYEYLRSRAEMLNFSDEWWIILPKIKPLEPPVGTEGEQMDAAIDSLSALICEHVWRYPIKGEPMEVGGICQKCGCPADDPCPAPPASPAEIEEIKDEIDCPIHGVMKGTICPRC